MNIECLILNIIEEIKCRNIVSNIESNSVQLHTIINFELFTIFIK